MDQENELSDLEIRINSNPFDVEAYIEKAMLLSDLGQEDEAYRCLNAAEIMVSGIEDDHERKETECSIYFVRAGLDKKNGKTPLEDLRKIIGLSDDPEQVAYAYHMIGEHLLKEEKLEEAEQAYANAYLQHPYPGLLYIVVMIKSKRKDYHGVVSILTGKEDLIWHDQRFYPILAQAEHALGNITRATEYLGHARELGPLGPSEEKFFAFLLREPQQNRSN